MIEVLIVDNQILRSRARRDFTEAQVVVAFTLERNLVPARNAGRAYESYPALSQRLLQGDSRLTLRLVNGILSQSLTSVVIHHDWDVLNGRHLFTSLSSRFLSSGRCFFRLISKMRVYLILLRYLFDGDR